MGNIKKTNIKNRTYYSFNDMINIKDLNSCLQKVIQKCWYLQHWIQKRNYDYENIHNVNLLYLIVSGKVIGHIYVKNKSKYLVFHS